MLTKKNFHATVPNHRYALVIQGLALLTLLLSGSAAFAAPQVQLSVTASVSNVAVGTVFDYTIQYKCASLTENCAAATVSDVLPAALSSAAADVTMVGSVHTTAQTYTAATRTAKWTFVDPLLAGSTGQLKLSVKFPTGTTADGTQAVNVATMAATGATPVSSPPVTVTATASNKWTLAKTRLSSGTGAALNEDTVYQLQICSNSSTLNLSNVVLTDVLPAGAVFVSASNGGVYANGNVTYSIGSIAASSSCGSYTLTLRYPSGTFAVGGSVTNTANVTATIPTTSGSGAITPLTASLTHSLSAGVAARTFTKKVSASSATVGQSLSYYFDTANTGNVALTSFSIEDAIPAQMNVTSISSGTSTNNVAPMLAVEYQTSANGNWTPVTGFPRALTSSAYSVAVSSLNLGSGVYITHLRYTFLTVPTAFKSSGSTASPGFAATVLTTDRSGGAVVPGAVVSNTGSYGFTYNGATTTGSSVATFTVAAPTIPTTETKAVPKVDKTIVTTTSVLPSALVTYEISLNNGSSAGATLSNAVLGDLLDAGLDYVAASWTVSTRPSGMPTPIFETVTNYNNTGRTLLRWRWEGASAYDLPINTTAKLRFQAKVKPGTLAGTLPNIAYLLGQANTALNTGSCNTLTADTFDLNGNGNKTETLCGSKTTGANLTVNASAAMESVMQVKGQLDSGYSQYPNSGLTVAGGSLLYRLQVSNVGNVPMKNAQVIDILPLVGDTGVLDPQNRQSAWRPNLIAPVIAPANVVVYYSTVSNPCRAELSYSPSGCATPNWSVTPPDDITQVQALKFDFGNIVLNPLDKLELNWPMRAPIGAPTHGEIAWNSFGFVATRADNSVTLLPSEPVKVGIAVQAPQPPGYGNYVWVDTNANGLQDSNEQGLNGVRVDLYAADGSVVDSTLTTNDGNGKPGFYQFTNLVPGTFHAVFYPPAGYAVTTRNVGSNRAIDSDVDPASNSTVPVTLTWGQIDYNWDLGLQVSKTASIGNYVWNDRNGDGLQNEATNDGVNGVSVKIYASNNTTTPVASVVTDDDLNGNPGYFRFDNLAPGSYFLEFIKPSGANFATRGTTAASSKVDPTTGRTASFSVVAGQYDVSWDAGVVLPVGTASLGDRIWLDANNNGLYEPFSGEQGIDGLRINLYRDTDGNGVFTPNIDQYYTTTTTYTAGGNPGYFSFGQLPPGRFIVQVDPVNFQNGKPLERLLASTVVTDPSNAVDNDNNGYLLAGFGAVSKAVTLTTAAQADLDFGFTATYSLGNRVFFDNGAGGGVTNDGLRNGAEPGIAGVVMKLFAADANGNPTGAVLATQSTDNEGFYRFDGLLYGQYVVVVDKTASSVLKDLVGSNGFAADFNITTDSRDHGKDVPLVKATVLPGGIASAPVSLGPNQQPLGESIGSTQASQNGPDGDANSNLTADFGFVQGYALGDRVWLDRNQDGIQQADERGIAGITVNLYAQDGATLLQSTVTDGSGFYQFPRVGSGTYVVGVAKPEGYSYSPLNQGTTGLKDSFDSDIDPTSGKTAAISFMGNLLTVDVGLYPSNGTAAARIADFVWYDTNHDGLQTANEPGLGGVTVNLWDAARQNLLAVAVSDANGFYEFASLAAGSYVVEFVAPTGYSRSPQQAGANNLDSDAAVATGLASVTVTAGQNADTVDAGFYLTGSQSGNSAAKLGDMVWYDINQDGNRDSGEPGLPGILVRLYASDTGILLAKTKTALDGSYAFAGLAAGNYTVEFVAPTSYAFSPQGHNSLADVKGQVSVQLTSNQSRTDIDAGLAIPGSQPISLGNKIWLDANADLGFDSGEGLAKAQVVLYNGVGQELARVNTSAADANYQFTGLGVGSYRVAVDKSTLPNNAALIADPDGVLDALHDMVNLKTSLISVDFGYSTHIDFGDLANSYATLLVNDGARHAVTGVYLGSRATDVEADGQASVNADADDLNGAAPDDEDGVTFSGAVLTSGQNASLKINASAAAVLNAWADWNHNGLFDGGERIVNNRALTAGQNSVAIAVASNASAGKTAFRFRVTNSQNQGGDSPTGLAKSGEVEDYLQMIYAAGQVGTIGGKVRFDNQGDGNLAAGYNGLAGAVVILYTDPNGDGNPADGMAVDSMVTDADGQYLFAATNTGKYVVVETNPSSYASSNDAVPPNDDRIPVAMPSFTAINGRDFLDAKTLHVGSVVGQVRNDSVGRGNMAGSFQGLSGAGLTLYTDPNGDGDPSDGLPYGATSSDNQGAYRFANLPLGSYVVVEANPVAIPPYFSTNDAVAPGNDDQVRVKLTLASANASGADFLDSQRAQPSIPPVDLQRIASKSLTDGMGNCTGTINPLKDASAQDLETYRLDNGGNLVFGFNVMESKDGTENPQSQGVTVKEARLDVTFSNGRQKSYALSEGACYTETYTLVTEKGGVERKPQYTLIGNDETKREGAVNSHQNTYDSALKCHIPDALDGASTASLSVEFMQTDTSRGDPEAFYDCSGKGEKLAVLNSADRDFVDGYHAGRQDAPAVALTNPTPIPDPMAVASWNYFPSATTYYFVAYEDQYPLLGDYDFNDAIIAYQVKLGMNSDNQVVRIEGVAYLMAKGAAYSHDWHLRMTLPSDVQSLVKCATSLAATPQTSVACTGSSLPLINGTVDLVAFQDTGKLFPNPLFTDYNRVYSNTLQWPVAARTYQKGPKSVFSIALSHPVDVDTVGKAPFDPYLYVRNTKKTVQLLQVNPAMKDVNGYPYAMMMPSTWNWPYERVDIRSSYPKFNTFVSTNATQAVDWYNFPATNSYFQLPVMATWSW